MNGKLAIVAALALAGCGPTKPSQPIDVHCDDLCFQQCDPLTAWDGDRDGDRLTALFDAHDVEHQQCEQHRKACIACLDTARKVGAIK